jgi:hypothetical protein
MQTNLSIFLFVTLTTMFLFSADLSAAKGFGKQTSSAESAAKSLYAARLKKKRAEALKVAAPGVVKKLFANGAGGWEFMGCEKQRSVWNCSYRYEGGGVNMTVIKKGSSHRVTAISYIAD